jgi:hypothetical protein
VLRPLYLASTRRDGYVSLEIASDLAHDTAGTIAWVMVPAGAATE